MENTVNFSEPFYDAIIDVLTNKTKTLTANNYDGHIVRNSVGYVTLAMYPDETRWTSAYLLEDPICPSNLEVLTGVTVDKVLFKSETNNKSGNKEIVATGVRTLLKDGSVKNFALSEYGEIVLASGSLGVPEILQRSGIGPTKLLERLGIEKIATNEEVGHGVDHIEGSVQYEFLEKWKDSDGFPPRGGPMDWPIAFFGDINDDDDDDTFFMCHFGLSPPPYDRENVLATPNVTKPNYDDGYQVLITTTDPNVQAKVVHTEQISDFQAMAKAVIKTVSWFEVLKEHSIVGKRIQPPLSVDLDNPKDLDVWLRENMGTVFHWMSTCKAGMNSDSVADNRFIVRNKDGYIKNLRLGSGAVLPEITEANPHITISTFSVALAHQLISEKCLRHNSHYHDPQELITAKETIQKNNGKVKFNNDNEVQPDLREVAKNHKKKKLFE